MNFKIYSFILKKEICVRNGDKNYTASILVNCLTMGRIPLSVLAYILVSAEEIKMLSYLFLFTAIAASDFFDGKAARAFHVQSNLGAAADVFCDFFYIITSCYALYRKGLFPLWMIVLIALKLVEFIMTSRVIQNRNSCRHICGFDYIGRYIAVVFYALPSMIIIFDRFMPAYIFYRTSYVLYVTLLFFSIFSSIKRIRLLA